MQLTFKHTHCITSKQPIGSDWGPETLDNLINGNWVALVTCPSHMVGQKGQHPGLRMFQGYTVQWLPTLKNRVILPNVWPNLSCYSPTLIAFILSSPCISLRDSFLSSTHFALLMGTFLGKISSTPLTSEPTMFEWKEVNWSVVHSLPSDLR